MVYIYANIWGKFMVNLTIYSIHGSYGIVNLPMKNRGSFHSYVNVCQRLLPYHSHIFYSIQPCGSGPCSEAAYGDAGYGWCQGPRPGVWTPAWLTALRERRD